MIFFAFTKPPLNICVPLIILYSRRAAFSGLFWHEEAQFTVSDTDDEARQENEIKEWVSENLAGVLNEDLLFCLFRAVAYNVYHIAVCFEVMKDASRPGFSPVFRR